MQSVYHSPSSQLSSHVANQCKGLLMQHSAMWGVSAQQTVCAWLWHPPGCGTEYRFSCRKGMGETRPITREGLRISSPSKASELALRRNRRGVKLYFPGSVEKRASQSKEPQQPSVSIQCFHHPVCRPLQHFPTPTQALGAFFIHAFEICIYL